MPTTFTDMQCACKYKPNCSLQHKPA